MGIFIFLIAVNLIGATAQENQKKGTFTVTATAINLKNKNGKIYFCLWRESDNGFPKCDLDAKPMLKKVVDASVGEAVFNEIEFGEYSVSLFHDENLNGHIQTNFFGLPKSGIGVSGEFSKPPKFKKTKILISGHQKVEIKTLYFLD